MQPPGPLSLPRPLSPWQLDPTPAKQMSWHHIYTMLQHLVNSVNSVKSSVNHLDVLSTRRQTSGLTEEIYADRVFFFLNWIDQMFWHHVDTSLSPAFLLMACRYSILSTCNMICLLNAMFSLPSKLWSEFPPPQSSSRLIPLNHSPCSF